MTMDHLVRVELADRSHRLPMPGTARLFGDSEVVDMREPFWIACVNDGSVKVVTAAPAEDPVPPPAASFEE